VRIAQLKSRAFLITAERLARITTRVISRTMASKRLFRTDMRNGSMRRETVSSAWSALGWSILIPPRNGSGDGDDEVAESVHDAVMAAFQIGGEGLRLEQAGTGNLRALSQLRQFVNRDFRHHAGRLVIDLAGGLGHYRVLLGGQDVAAPDFLPLTLADRPQ